jgi:hypothetical protein
MLTGHGMKSGHQTLNDAKLVFDNLKETNLSIYNSSIQFVVKLSSTKYKEKHLSKSSKAVSGAASVGDNGDVRLVFLLVDTMTNMGVSLLGAEMMTFLAPPCKWQHGQLLVQTYI